MLVHQNCSLVNILWIAFVLFQRRLSTIVEMFIFCFCLRCFILLISLLVLVSKAVTQTCSARKMFLKISQTSKENSCARVSFLIKLKTFLIECLWWLLLQFTCLVYPLLLLLPLSLLESFFECDGSYVYDVHKNLPIW